MEAAGKSGNVCSLPHDTPKDLTQLESANYRNDITRDNIVHTPALHNTIARWRKHHLRPMLNRDFGYINYWQPSHTLVHSQPVQISCCIHVCNQLHLSWYQSSPQVLERCWWPACFGRNFHRKPGWSVHESWSSLLFVTLFRFQYMHTFTNLQFAFHLCLYTFPRCPCSYGFWSRRYTSESSHSGWRVDWCRCVPA